MTKKTKRFLALLLSGLLTLSLVACEKPEDTPTGGGGDDDVGGTEAPITGNWYDDENFKPVVRFVVTADTHFGTGTTDYYYWSQDLYAKLFQHSYAYADSQEYDKLDAIFNVGDWLDHGYPGEYENFIRVSKENLREGTEYVPVLAGHELISGSEDDYTTNMRMEKGCHLVINGYHFIASGNGSGSNTAPCMGWDWLEEQVELAYNDDPYKPIFIFQHHPINNTIPSSNDNRESERYHNIYKKYFIFHLPRLPL